MKRNIVIGLLGIVVLVAAPAFGRGAGNLEQPYRLMIEGDFAGMGRSLQLQGSQRQQMEAMHRRDLPRLHESKQALEAQTRILFKLYEDPQVDEAKLRAQFDKVQGLMHRTMATHFDHMLAMRGLLTPGQRGQFLERGARLLGEHDEQPMRQEAPAKGGGPRGR